MSPTSLTRRLGGALINRNYRLLFTGQAISNVGDFVFDTTLILWIATRLAAGKSWAPLAVSGVLVAVALPEVLFGPLAGVFVDRWDKRHTMLMVDLLRAGLIVALAIGTGALGLPFLSFHPTASAQLIAVYAVVLLTTSCAQFFVPSRMALVGDIVPTDQRTKASGLSQITQSLAMIAGPPLAAPLLFGLGVQWALLLNAASFLASFVAVYAIQAPPAARSLAAGEQPHFAREFVAGLRFFAGSRILMTILVAGIIIMLGAGALNALDIFFVTQNLHASARLFGILTSAQGIGVLAGAVLASTLGLRLGPARLFWLALLAAGVVLFVYSRLTSFGVAVAVILVGSLPFVAVNVAVAPLVLHATPRELVGRVMAVINPAVSLASIVSMVLAGWLVSSVLRGLHLAVLGTVFTPVDTVFAASALLCFAGGLYAMAGLRGVAVEASAPAATVPSAEAPPSTLSEAAGDPHSKAVNA